MGSGESEEGTRSPSSPDPTVERSAGERGEDTGRTTKPALEASLPSKGSAAGSTGTTGGSSVADRGARVAWQP